MAWARRSAACSSASSWRISISGVALVFVVGGLDGAQGVVDGAQGVVVWLARGGGDGREVPFVVARLKR
jgi:hypothetical protein